MRLRRWQPWQKSSTRAFAEEARSVPGFSLFDRLHAHVYLRWLYLYIGVGTGESRLARALAPLSRLIYWRSGTTETGNGNGNARAAFADGYHGKVVQLDQARQLVTLNENVDLRDLEQIIPYSRARDIVLRNPDHIVALECPCRAARENPCTPLDVCLVVGEPFASMIREHHPEKSRWITQAEASEILRAEHERGHVHHAFFKDAMLERFYAICNCCSCCCGAMQARRNGTPMLASSGYVSRIDPDLCYTCERCIDACQFGAISVPDDVAVVDADLCMGCGVCVDECVREAHTLVRDPSRGEPLEICDLIGGGAPADCFRPATTAPFDPAARVSDLPSG